jgi:hypothetical protein
MDKEEIKRQINTLKLLIRNVSENETIRQSKYYEEMIDKYLDELNDLLNELEKE